MTSLGSEVCVASLFLPILNFTKYVMFDFCFSVLQEFCLVLFMELWSPCLEGTLSMERVRIWLTRTLLSALLELYQRPFQLRFHSCDLILYFCFSSVNLSLCGTPEF